MPWKSNAELTFGNYYDEACLMSWIIKPASAVLVFFFTIQIPLACQEPADRPSRSYAELVEWAYGQDQELVNGLQYYNRHPRSLGHPYLMEGLVHQGSVNLRGKLYTGLWLKYDIHDQHVEVEYQTVGGADNQVILVNDRVNSFTIGNQYFERMKLEDGPARFYQVLVGAAMTWYIHWEKKLVPMSGDSRFIEEYTSPKRSYLLELDGSIYPFSNKKSFVRLFPKSIQKDMKKLIRNNHIPIRSASTEQLELFIIAASRLLTEGSP
jgi:hypothetical protein